MTEPFGGSRLIGAGLRFACQGCGRCCSGPGGFVFLTEEEGRAMAACLGMAAEDFFARRTRRAEGRIALVDRDNGDCCFLRQGRCLVYPARPWQCRSWPFWFKNLRSDEAWRRVARECPGVGKGPLHTPEEIMAWLDGGK